MTCISIHGSQVKTYYILLSAYKVKRAKLSLCLINYTPRHEDVWGSGGIAPPFLTSELDGGEWPASCPSRFTPGERVPGTHWTGGWVSPRAGLDAVE
jgi:hypothetical protein